MTDSKGRQLREKALAMVEVGRAVSQTAREVKAKASTAITQPDGGGNSGGNGADRP